MARNRKREAILKVRGHRNDRESCYLTVNCGEELFEKIRNAALKEEKAMSSVARRWIEIGQIVCESHVRGQKAVEIIDLIRGTVEPSRKDQGLPTEQDGPSP